jgi:hypothetical protein
MISQGSVSFPVSSLSISCLNSSFGITRPLCNQVAQSRGCLSLLASFDADFLVLGVMAAWARQLTLIRLRDFELQQFA